MFVFTYLFILASGRDASLRTLGAIAGENGHGYAPMVAFHLLKVRPLHVDWEIRIYALVKTYILANLL